MDTNNFKTFILLTAIVLLFMVVGGLIGGQNGMLIALVFAVGVNFFAYWYSADMVLKMYNAQEIGPHDAPDLYNIIGQIAYRANIPMPKVFVINEAQPNAFATGRDPENAAILLTVGLIKLLDYDELSGVIAHEISHIKHRDILISTIAAVIAGAISGLASFAMFFGNRDEHGRHNMVVSILLAIFAPIAASLIQMAISRSREYMADEGAANLTQNPLALASALGKIDALASGLAMPVAEEHPTTAHMMIINPLTDGYTDNLFATHPTTQNRIMRLETIAQNMHSKF